MRNQSSPAGTHLTSFAVYYVKMHTVGFFRLGRSVQYGPKTLRHKAQCLPRWYFTAEDRVVKL